MSVSIAKRITGYTVVGKEASPPGNAFTDDAERRLRFAIVPTPLAKSLRWAKRPDLPGGNPSQTYRITGPSNRFAVVVGHIQNGHAYPFEAWAIGEAPRGLSAIAQSLSMDMRSRDRAFLTDKLESLIKTKDKPFDLVMPDGKTVEASSEVAAFARLVQYRCRELGAFDDMSYTPIHDALMSLKEPKTRAEGGLSWYADIANPVTGDNFTMFVKEAILPNGQKRPFSVWLSGDYPRSLDGLCKALSFDLRVVEAEWGLLKLQQLLDCAEPQGQFRAQVPGSDKSSEYPSTVAYMAALLLHRLSVLGIADLQGQIAHPTGVVSIDSVRAQHKSQEAPRGALCEACGAYAVKVDGGCKTCVECGESKCS